MNTNHSPKRLVVIAVIENIRRVQALLTDAKCSKRSCETAWSKHQEFAGRVEVSVIKWGPEQAKQREEALARYDSDIVELEKEIKNWELALGHALDSLEGRV
jgi:hypothetical protein